MIRTGNPMTKDESLPAIHALIHSLGARRVFIAAALALLRPAPRRPLAVQFQDLDNHLRRDIGLPPKAASPPMPPGMQHTLW